MKPRDGEVGESHIQESKSWTRARSWKVASSLLQRGRNERGVLTLLGGFPENLKQDGLPTFGAPLETARRRGGTGGVLGRDRGCIQNKERCGPGTSAGGILDWVIGGVEPDHSRVQEEKGHSPGVSHTTMVPKRLPVPPTTQT